MIHSLSMTLRKIMWEELIRLAKESITNKWEMILVISCMEITEWRVGKQVVIKDITRLEVELSSSTSSTMELMIDIDKCCDLIYN